MIFKSTAISLAGGLLLRLLFPQQSPPLLYARPSFLEQVPPGHYLGISIECQQLAKAKEDSMENVIKQILQQIGAEYNLEFEKVTYVEDNQVDVTVKDSFSYNTAGMLADIEVKDSYFEKFKGKYVFYTLVYFPQSKIILARKMIEEENSKRLAQYKLFIKRARLAESKGNITDALHHYGMAVRQAEELFKERKVKKVLAEGYMDNIASRIKLKAASNYNQRNRHFVRCKVLYGDNPVSDIPVRFQLTKGKGFITSHGYSDFSGIARCDVNMRSGYPNNKIIAWVDIKGVDSEVVFNFSTVEPRPVIKASPLEVRDNCFSFRVIESNDVDVVFDSYDIFIDAKYKNASFINYYIAHVDNGKHTSCSFNLLNPIRIKGGTSQVARIPFNNWTREKIDELDKWYMGSRLDYRIVLKGDDFSISVQ